MLIFAQLLPKNQKGESLAWVEMQSNKICSAWHPKRRIKSVQPWLIDPDSQTWIKTNSELKD